MIFSYLKKRSMNRETKFGKEFTAVSPLLFPNGIQQAKSAYDSICFIANTQISIELFFNIYSDVYARTKLMSMDVERIITAILVKYDKAVPMTEIKLIIAYIIININDNSFVVNTKQDLEKLMTDSMKVLSVSLEPIQDEGACDSDYGLSAKNPISARGVKGSHIYLSQLYTINGEKLSWKRYGSFTGKNECDTIDGYDLFLPDGKVYTRAFINMYTNGNSKDTPHNLKRIIENTTMV